MNKNIGRVGSLLLLMLLLVSVGCGTLVQNLSPKQQYLAARVEYNTLQSQYLDYYDAAPAATQAKWKAGIDPYFDQADVALDMWGLAVRSGTDATAQQKAYIAIKNKLIDLLADVLDVKGDN